MGSRICVLAHQQLRGMLAISAGPYELQLRRAHQASFCLRYDACRLCSRQYYRTFHVTRLSGSELRNQSCGVDGVQHCIRHQCLGHSLLDAVDQSTSRPQEWPSGQDSAHGWRDRWSARQDRQREQSLPICSLKRHRLLQLFLPATPLGSTLLCIFCPPPLPPLGARAHISTRTTPRTNTTYLM